MRRQAQVGRSLRGMVQLIDRPSLAFDRIVSHFGRREAIEACVVGGMHGDQLSLKMRRKLGDFEPMARRHAFEIAHGEVSSQKRKLAF